MGAFASAGKEGKVSCTCVSHLGEGGGVVKRFTSVF